MSDAPMGALSCWKLGMPHTEAEREIDGLRCWGGDPAGAPIAPIASAFPRTADRAYRWVTRHRERLGRVLGERACAVDPAERDW